MAVCLIIGPFVQRRIWEFGPLGHEKNFPSAEGVGQTDSVTQYHFSNRIADIFNLIYTDNSEFSVKIFVVRIICIIFFSQQNALGLLM